MNKLRSVAGRECEVETKIDDANVSGPELGLTRFLCDPNASFRLAKSN